LGAAAAADACAAELDTAAARSAWPGISALSGDIIGTCCGSGGASKRRGAVGLMRGMM
jgi:hypothetical protein